MCLQPPCLCFGWAPWLCRQRPPACQRQSGVIGSHITKTLLEPQPCLACPTLLCIPFVTASRNTLTLILILHVILKSPVDGNFNTIKELNLTLIFKCTHKYHFYGTATSAAPLGPLHAFVSCQACHWMEYCCSQTVVPLHSYFTDVCCTPLKIPLDPPFSYKTKRKTLFASSKT